MAKEPRPKGYPKLKNYKPSQFMLPTSHYDKKKADRAVTFIENLCHTKGKWAGTPFWLLPWQEQLIRDIFGIVKPDGNRQFRTAFVEICKKVGKSELAAAVALYLLYADNEPSAEVYGAAADRQQASIVFDVAKQMVEMSPALMKRSKLMGATKRIVNYSKVLSKLGYSLRVSVRNIETIKDTGMYMAPNIQLFELDIDKESNIGKFFKGSDLVIGAIGPSADYSEKMLLEAMAENIPYVDPGGIHLIRKMRNSSMKGTAIVGSGIFPGLSGWMLSSVLKEAFNDDLIEMIIGGVYNFSKAAAIDYVEEIKSYKAGIPMACVRNGKILPAQKRSPLNLPTRISKLSILPYVTEEIQEIIQGKYMLNIDSYTAAPVSLFSIVNKAHCQKKDLVNALMGQKNSNQKAFIWVRQNKGNDSRCIYFEGKNPSVLTGEILAITANAIFEMPRKDGIYTMASYLEKYQVLDELKKIDKFKSEGKI